MSRADQVLHHGAIGNGRVLALVSPTTSIDWYCLPRFDSPSVFGALLDEERGGRFQLLGGDAPLATSMEYVRNTNVLRTVARRDDCEVEIYDFAPRVLEGLAVRAPLEIVRLILPLRGHARLRARFEPRPDYGRVVPMLVPALGGIDVLGAGLPLRLLSNVPADYLLAGQEFLVDRPRYFVLRAGADGSATSVTQVRHELHLTLEGWRSWARTCALPGFAAEQVLRSALCLKLHVHEETGAIIAAATTSIPEAIGSGRTWDYRYCWLRDAAFVVEALRRLSHLAEGQRFVMFLRDVAEGGPLQPVYGVGGERELPEVILEHLSGFRGSGPVRVGNAASSQRQNDLMGELVLSLATVLTDPRVVLESREAFLPLLRRLVEDAVHAAPEPDTGIWEFRTLLRPYTLSRAMCWVAMDRGAELAARLGDEVAAARFRAHAARERRIVLERGYSSRHGMFTQALDGQYADAANLLLPTLGLLDARDPRFLSTIDAYERLLVERGLMLRYRNEDDFGETTSAFTMCSFWWAEALALAGRLEAALEVFDRIVGYANPLGIFSEDIDPTTGALLGNFPQAYTHVGLIHAATTISVLLDARDGRVRAWR